VDPDAGSFGSGPARRSGLDTVDAVNFPAGSLTAVYAVSSLATPATFDLVVQSITLDRGARVITADGGQYALGNA
jgi:hypothetical protein